MRKPAATRLFPASGGFNAGDVVKVIRFVRMGCANRPFYHIVVAAIFFVADMVSMTLCVSSHEMKFSV
ncbi:hypothetical protein J6590_048495 [Homalodisca vitripennis]|nr:hypothetical protein J6590_048495 [Homalodisca vitripennis]